MQRYRSVFCKAFVWMIAFFLLIQVHTEFCFAQEDPLNLYARSAVLMDGDSGRILYGKEADTELPMASTTKIMTCIVALEHADTQMVCEVSANAAGQPKVKLGMQTGEQYYLKDLLYSLMLESHNDTAVCIAENVAGSVEAFADLMNRKAKEIGCKNTYYITANGLDAENDDMTHHTTARELALVMRYCTSLSEKAEEFLEITEMKEWSFSDVEAKRSHYCANHNTLLSMMEGVISGKTGYTGKAGYCYVGAMKKDGKYLIVSLLACGWPNHKGYKWSDSKKLLRYGMENFTVYELEDTEIKTKPVQVKNGKKTVLNTRIEENRYVPKKILVHTEEKVKIHTEQKEKITAPVKYGTCVGNIRYSVGNFIAAEYGIIVSESCEKKDYMFCFAKGVEILLL